MVLRRLRWSWLCALLAIAIGCVPAASRRQRPPVPQPHPAPRTIRAGTSGAIVRFDSLFYDVGGRASITLSVVEGTLAAKRVPIVVVSPETGDLEVLTAEPTKHGREYRTTAPLPLAGATTEPATQLDGVLAAKPGEFIYALFYPDYPREPKLAGTAQVVFDVAILDGGLAAPQPQVLAELAMTDDERRPPPGGKTIGTIVEEHGLPLQLPVDELIFYPRDARDLKRFLHETRGRVVATDPVRTKPRAATSVLVQVDTSRADVQRLPVMQALMGVNRRLYVSSPEVLRLLALALTLHMEGYVIALNPRLQAMGAPQVTEHRAPPISPGTQMTDDHFQVDRTWTFLALREADTRRVNVGILDQGFCINPDFRGFPGAIAECDMEGANLVEGLTRGFRCGPGVAEGPPTVNAGFFGNRTWHGNMIAATIGGVLNNGFGTQGVGGQVVQPMLFRFGLASYAFEIGLGISKAAEDGANVINVSAGYPCRLVTNLGVDPGICGTGERAAFCTLVTAGLVLATAAVCAAAAAIAAIPIIGLGLAAPVIAACIVAAAATLAASGACFATLIAGDPRGPMQRGVDLAAGRGVPVIANAGNILRRGDLPPVIGDIIDTTDNNADDWRIIPCVLNNVICVGAADATVHDPTNLLVGHPNLEFVGPSVDIWAPDGANFFRPDQTATCTPPTDHHADSGFGGQTSAATAYVTGVVAALQAISPNLDPQRRTADPGRIPAETLALLRQTGWPASTADGRGILINPRAAVEAAAAPNFRALGYDQNLNFDETGGPSGDTQGAPFDLGVLGTTPASFTHTIHNLPAQPSNLVGFSGVASVDRDWIRFGIPASPPGLRRALVELRVPAVTSPTSTTAEPLQLLRLDGDRHTLFGILNGVPTPLEHTDVYQTPRMLSGATSNFQVHGISGSDNVYALRVTLDPNVEPLPTPDRFDTDDLHNPLESRPRNDDPMHATWLASDNPTFPELGWHEVSTSPPTVYVTNEIVLSNLNFDRPDDRDYFNLITPARVVSSTLPNCEPWITVTAPDVHISARRDAALVSEGDSPLRFHDALAAPLTIELRPRIPQSFITYDVSFRFETLRGRLCR